MRYCVTKVAVPKKNNEALNGKDLMIERKEQCRKVKKNIKNGRNFDISRNNRHQMTSKTEFLKKCYQVILVEI